MKKRILPLKGEIVAKVGDKVKPTDVVAKTDLPGNVEQMNIANLLGCDAEDLKYFMLVKEGDKITDGQIVARNKGIFSTGLFKTSVKAPFEGSIESISPVTGNVLFRALPIPIEATAYVEGEVTEIIPDEGAIITTHATFIQGIFGIGGERFGEIIVLTKDNTGDLTEEMVKEEHRGKVIVCGRKITSGAYRKAISIGVKAIVAGGVDDRDLRQILGYDIGVAITGSEDVYTAIVTTEGFGEIPMAQRTFEILKKFEGKGASVNGATQIRAGVIRPEIVIAQSEPPAGFTPEGTEETIGLSIGSQVRVIRYPYFGKIGKVTALPPELRVLESESKARVLEVEFDEGARAIVPRANVETIENF
jgi:hypothetical protein